MVQAPEQSTAMQVQAVSTNADLQLFFGVPQRVYANDPNWVQPLRSSIAKQLDSSNPFYTYGSFQAFIALKGDESGKQTPVGRIVAAVNRRLIEREGQNVGLFGYFECIEDLEVAKALFSAAEDWLRSQGMATIRGPIDLSTHNNCLMLVDGFDSPPMVMMPYNPSYYPQFMEQQGWHKAKDAYAYDISIDMRDEDQPLPEKFKKAYERSLNLGITYRPIRTKGEGFEQDCRAIYDLFTKAFSNNWSSTPRTEEEFLEEAKDLQTLVDPDVFPIAEHNGEMVGFWMALPDYNIALKHVNGKLDWCGIVKFLWYRRKIDQGRVIAICSLPDYRRKFVPLGLIYLGMMGGTKKGKPYKRAELSWVFEDNWPSRKLIEASGGTIQKTYRIYEKSLG